MDKQKRERGDIGEVLLVDDSPASLKLLSLWLREAGYSVRQAPSGELALWSIHSRHPDLILLDVRMPAMDGFETCRRLKADARHADIPVIFLSAENDTGDRVHGLQIGAVDFIAKNFTREEVLARVDTHIALAKAQKALLRERQTLEERVRQRTAEIEANKALLQRVIDTIPDWVYVKDRQHRFLLVNRTMAEACGQPPEAMIGHLDREIFAGTGRLAVSGTKEEEQRWQAIHRDDDSAFAGSEVQREICEWSVNHGENRIYETFRAPLFAPDGSVGDILCYRRDITDKRRSEEARREVEEHLWRAQKMQAIGQLTGGIAHDFNNILATILGFGEIAHAALSNGRSAKLDYYLTEILQAGQTARELVAQLLSFSRGESPGDAPGQTLQTVAPAVEQVVRLLAATLGSGMRIGLDIATALPPLRLSATHLHQILMNLGINARDACNGEGEISITVDREELPHSLSCSSCHEEFSGRFVRLTLKDNGPGIAPEHRERIFDPFFSTKDVGKGTGLGLSVTHGIVHAAGGHLRVTSAPGEGTRFDLYLPPAAEHPAHAGRSGIAAAQPERLSARLLVVDDESSIVAFIKELFESRGCAVSSRTDPQQALTDFFATPAAFDLAILDQGMPGMSGSELARQLLAARPDLPIVLLSGIDMPTHGEALPAATVHHFLPKPVSCLELEKTVATLLATARIISPRDDAPEP